MGQLFTHAIAVWLDHQHQHQQTSTILTHSFIESKPIVSKRKRDDHDDASIKRRVVHNSLANSDDDDDDDNTGVSLSPRIPPIVPKINSSPGLIRRFLNSSSVSRSSFLTLFKCQLCRRGFTDKDIYLDHMIMCAIERQAPIKIVRAKQTLTRTRHDLLLTRENPIRRRRPLFNPCSGLRKEK